MAEPQQLAAVAGRLEAECFVRDGLGRDAEHVGGRGGGQEVLHEVRPGERQRHVERAARHAQVEAHPEGRAAPALGRDVEAAVASEPHRAAREALADSAQARVVAVQHGGPAGAQPLQDLGLRVRDRVERGEELQVDAGRCG